MKKFILGLSFGLIIASASVAFASSSIQALLFPASFEINGKAIALNADYKVLNVDGYDYVPIRFVADNLGATIDYDAELKKVIVKNRGLDLTDPNYKGISVGNLILTKSGGSTKVTGQLSMFNVGNSQNKIEATLSFYNDKSEKIGNVVIKGDNFESEKRTFVVEGLGDFRAYTTVNLHITAVNNNVISESPSLTYANTKHNFTLKLPQSWDGKYEVIEEGDNINFISKANNTVPKGEGFMGVLFTIHIWPKEQWSKEEATIKGQIQISKIGERGNTIFTLNTPSDVQYDPSNEKLTAEYNSMWSHVNTIKTSFKLGG